VRLREIFDARGKCFIPFLTAGHPDLGTTRRLVLEMASQGAAIVEIGIPFSDPIADGPVIQRSSFQALSHGHTISDYLELVRAIRRESDVGLLFMSYLNPLLRFGLERLDREGEEAGLDGVLISDLTPEEYLRWPEDRQIHRLDRVFLVSPTSSDARIEAICKAATGFVYLVARLGVTGAETVLGEEFGQTLARIRCHTDLPVAAGFGINSRESVARVLSEADGAIVGSALVDFIERHRQEPDLVQQVGDYVRNSLLPSQLSRTLKES